MTDTITNASSDKPKVLAIDDNNTNLALLKVHLTKMGITPVLARDAVTGIEMAHSEQPDLILLDIMMPKVNGFEACKRLKSDPVTAEIPVIFVSAKDMVADKVAGLELGAVDYITKPFDPVELKARVRQNLKLRYLQKEMALQAHTDPLTGLANRRHFIDILEREMLHCQSQNLPLSLMIFDLDHFKRINDTYGHLGGDSVLKQFADIMKKNIPSQYPLDVVARYGGEEFAVILPQTPLDKAVIVAERLRSKVEGHNWSISAQPLSITASVGVAVTDNAATISMNELIERADTALYTAKDNGRNRVVTYDEIKQQREIPREIDKKEMRNLQSKIKNIARSGSIKALHKTLSDFDPMLISNAEAVAHYAGLIAREMQLPEDTVSKIETAALLHNIGKMYQILNTNAPVIPTWHSDNDNTTLHMLVAVQLLAPLGIFQNELPSIKHQAEHFDGSGLPNQLKGKRIPFGARVLAPAIALNWLTNPDYHTAPLPVKDALSEIQKQKNTLFDPEVVDALTKAISKKCDETTEATPPAMTAV